MIKTLALSFRDSATLYTAVTAPRSSFLFFLFSFQVLLQKSKRSAETAGNGFSIGGSGLLEPLRCLVRGREDPLKAKAFPPLFGYSREVGHSPGTGYEYGY